MSAKTTPAPATDRYSRFRAIAFYVLAAVLCIFVLLATNINLFGEQPNLALFGMLGCLLVFLSFSLVERWKDASPLRILDIVLMLATLVSFGFIFVQSEPRFQYFWIDGTLLGDRAGNETTLDYVLALIGLIVVLEATRRSIGWTLPILCVLFILYALSGASLPDWLFPHRGSSWQRIVQKTFLQSGGVFGIALKVMFYYVFLFVLFGTLLEQTGATAYVIRFARRLFQHSSGGPAKVAVVSSGMMGSLSGSAVANTATTGTFTIPLMRSTGFRPEEAAGVEAAASSGGALMPPVMGAGAFMMLEMVDPPVTYPQIIKAAIIPALLYYTSLLLMVHFHAKRIGATAEKIPDQDDSQVTDWYQGFVFFGSFAILIAMLVPPVSFTPYRAVSISLAGILFLSLFSRHTRMWPRQIFAALVGAAKAGMALIVATSCVGIILGVVGLTGLDATLPARVLELSNDNAIMALALLMVSTIILGMGLPSAVCYLLMAILVGSVLGQLQTAPLAAHLFIFYFGMMSMVTPPVALAAYAGAAIAKADVMKSAFAAFRFALVGFALPFAFVLRPELIMLTAENEPASVLMIAINVLTTLIAIVGLAAGLAGFAFRRLSLGWRVPLIIFSLTVFFTRLQGIELAVQLMSVAMVVGLFVLLSIDFRHARRLET